MYVPTCVCVHCCGINFRYRLRADGIFPTRANENRDNRHVQGTINLVKSEILSVYVHVYTMYIRRIVSARFRENSARTNVEYAVIRHTGACIASVKLAGYNSLVKQLDFSPKLPDTAANVIVPREKVAYIQEFAQRIKTFIRWVDMNILQLIR